MIHRVLQVKSLALLLAVMVGLILIQAPTPAEPVQTKQDPLVAKMVCEFLKRGHLNRPELGDEISKRLFHRFLKDLDPDKIYFMKSDIDEFKKHETELDDQLLAGDVSFAYKVYEQLLERIGERQKLIEEFVQAKHDFTVKEYLDTDPDAIDYAAPMRSCNERWRKRIKFDLLLQRIGDKPVPEAEAKQKDPRPLQGRSSGAGSRWTTPTSWNCTSPT